MKSPILSEIKGVTIMHDEPKRINRIKLPGRVQGSSARQADLELLSQAPADYLDTTHFDTVRFPPPQWAVSAFDRAAKDGSLAYTPYRGNDDVLRSLAKTLEQFLGVALNPKEHIVLTPGTQAGLFATLTSIAEEKERIALVDPDYLFNARMLEFLNADIGYVPLRQSSTKPTLDFDILEKEFSEHGARVLVFSNPNNPTGYVYSTDDLKKIARMVEKYDVTVVADSLYSRLMHEKHPYTHLCSLPGMQDRVITLLGPSKTESLSGYRLGVVVGPAAMMNRLENVLSIISLRAPAYAQHLLPIWLRDDQEWLQQLLPDFTALRRMTVDSLRRLPWLRLEPQPGTAYVWPDVSALQMSDFDVAKALLTRAGVLVSPGYQFGIQGDGHFRICYARDETQWSLALDRMVKVLDELAVERGLETIR